MVHDKNHVTSLAILGVVAAISIVGLTLLFANAQNTGHVVLPGDKVYGGAIEGEQYPYLVGRRIGGTEEEYGTEEQAWQTGVPYRTYHRAQVSIPSDYTACGPQEREMGVTHAREQMYRYGFECRRLQNNAGQLVAFCCPIPEYATGTAQEVTKQGMFSQ